MFGFHFLENFNYPYISRSITEFWRRWHIYEFKLNSTTKELGNIEKPWNKNQQSVANGLGVNGSIIGVSSCLLYTSNTNLTREELEILAKVPNDVFLFSLFCYVIHPVRGKVRFELYPYQKSVLYQFVKERFNILLKFRQAGITELISMYCLWLAMYHPNKKINIISIKDTTAKKVLKKIKFMYKNLPNSASLKTLFKAVYGLPIATYMKKRRMEEAMKLLRETNRQIADIASAVGYESQGKFTRAFKEEVGILPREYRKIQTGA